MHDIDRTQLERAWETDPYGNGEFEEEFDGYGEIYGETFDDEFEYEDEFEYGDEYEYDDEFEYEYEVQGPLDEADEMELAAELLEITDEDELDQFLGKVFRRVAKKVRRVVPKSVRRTLGRGLRRIARRALPMAGAALGNLVAPGIGGMAGGAIASQAGRLFGLELEGLSPEDQEFEVARSFVRMASEAARQAAVAPRGAPPQAVAKRAITAAAKQHAPGLVGAKQGRARGRALGRRGQRGTWIRRGNAIILHGLNR
ncbi:MAG: hypothetical protein RRC07_09310 [Anaerolineae bacterium]|nr:hypothetical protein [Anaerolineae bacterium]